MRLTLEPDPSGYAPLSEEHGLIHESSLEPRKERTVSFTLRAVLLYHIALLLVTIALVGYIELWFSWLDSSSCQAFREEDFGG